MKSFENMTLSDIRTYLKNAKTRRGISERQRNLIERYEKEMASLSGQIGQLKWRKETIWAKYQKEMDIFHEELEKVR